jgi:hypothetical protein
MVLRVFQGVATRQMEKTLGQEADKRAAQG